MFYENDFICCLSASYNEVRNMSKDIISNINNMIKANYNIMKVKAVK